MSRRYVLIDVYDVDEFAMPTPDTPSGSNDPRARLNVGALREIVKADVVIAVDPGGAAAVVKDGDSYNPESATVTYIDARPRGMA